MKYLIFFFLTKALMADSSSNLLKKFDALPNLLTITNQTRKPEDDVYNFQDNLHKDYMTKKTSHIVAMPMRTLLKCPTGEHHGGEVKYTIYNPKRKSKMIFVKKNIDIMESEIHAVRFHKGKFTSEQEKFLNEL